MTEKKNMKINFAPGCFDHFDGTQEELDDLMSQILKMFEGKTAEELEAMSKPLSEEDFNELPDDVKEQLAYGVLEAFHNLDSDNEPTNKRRLH